MSWDFFVPVSAGDLVKSGGINQYVVQDVAAPKHLPPSLSSKRSTFEAAGGLIGCRTAALTVPPPLSLPAGLRLALRSRGPLCILEHFDTGYSVLQ